MFGIKIIKRVKKLEKLRFYQIKLKNEFIY